MRTFTRAELAAYHGRDGAPAYIAYAGAVYDATASFLWQRGRHQARHSAGLVFTVELDQAPHSADLLERLPVVGVLLDED